MGVSDRVAIFTKDQPVTFASSRPMTLDQFLKFVGVVGSGGQAIQRVGEGRVAEGARGQALIPKPFGAPRQGPCDDAKLLLG